LPDVEPQPTDVEFTAYAEDCILTGRIRLEADRLSDHLNMHDEYRFEQVLAQGLDDERAIELTELVVPRTEILLVHGAGPRGDRDRRQRMRQHAIALKTGPYEVRGYLHAQPGTDPVASFRRRRTMVAITDAWIEYSQGNTRQRRRVSLVIVNRPQVDWIVQTVDEEILDDQVGMPDLPLPTKTGPLLKDFTGSIVGPSLDNKPAT
jgi:hypothetical protein